MTEDDGAEVSALPSDIGAERSVLGAAMLSPAVLTEIAPLLAAADFYDPKHEMIYAAILGLYGAGSPVEAGTVADALTRSGELSRVGGGPYLHTLLASCTATSSAAFYAALVREKSVARGMVLAGQRIARLGMSPDGDVDSKLAEASAELSRVAESIVSGDHVGVLSDRVDAIFERLETANESGGLRWGWPDLDRLLRPATPGQLIVVSGRPGMGKSTYARCVAWHMAVEQGARVLISGLEMSREEIEDTLVSAATGIPLQRVIDRQLSEYDWERMAKAHDRIARAEIVIDSTPELTLPGWRAAVRRHKPAIAIIDQVQLMTIPQTGNREESVGALSRGLKVAAGAEGIPVVAVSKMNRGPEYRTDKRPLMSDLRESGSLESDADAVILLYREEVYEKESPRTGEVDIIVAKQRRGEQGTVTLAAQLHCARFTSMFQEAS